MKFWKLNLTLLVGIVLVIALVGCLGKAPIGEPVVTQGIGPRPLTPYLAHFNTITAIDKWAILVDLSDSTNFPHRNTNSIILKQIQFDGALNTAKTWDTSVGVVTATDADGTDIEWIRTSTPIEAALIRFDSTWTLPEHGLNLVVSSGSLPFVVTNDTETTAVITSSTAMSSSGSASAMVGVGDIILLADEITDGAAFTLTVEIAYDTE